MRHLILLVWAGLVALGLYGYGFDGLYYGYLSIEMHSLRSLLIQWALLLTLPTIWLYLVVRKKRKDREK